MNVFKQMLSSKKWTTAVLSIIALVASDFYGVELDPMTMQAVLAMVITIIGAEGIADAAGARASRKHGPPQELLTEVARLRARLDSRS